MTTYDFNRKTFYKTSKKYSLKNILINNSLFLKSTIDKNFVVTEISSLNNLKNNSIIFVNKKNIKNFLLNIKNNPFTNIHVFTDSEVILNEKIKSYTLVNNLKLIYNTIINDLIIHPEHLLYKDKFIKNNNSYISINSSVHKSVTIGNNCVIGKGVFIGKNSIIKDNVVIKNSILEENVIIHENCVIGSAGFGFDPNNLTISRNEPQIGIVVISKNCSIGSSCTLDRGKIDCTYLGESCMLDNQVHIAHNVLLGNNVIIAAQSGIAGSTKIGNNVMIGGQSGISGHLKIGNNVVIAAKSGVTKNIINNSVVAGFPAIDINKWKKMIINQRKI